MFITFAVVAVFTSPSSAQKALDRRMLGIRASASGDAPQDEISTQILKVGPSSDFEWFEKFFEEFSISRALQLKIVQADSKTTVGKLALTTLGMAFAGMCICYLFVPVLKTQLLVAFLLSCIPYRVLMFKRSRRIDAFNKALPDAIDMMGRALRAGHSMVAAIGIIAEQSAEPVRSEFNEVFKQQNFGLPLRDALMQMLEHVPSSDLRVLVTGILVQKETGGNLAEILDRIVFVIRERLRIHGEIRTHTAQGRMTGWILCLLPVLMLGAINIINPGYSHVLFYTPLGNKLLWIGIALLVKGGLIIRKIINGIEV